MSNEKNPGCLLGIQGIILPSYVGIIVSHYTISVMESHTGFERCSCEVLFWGI